MSSPEALAKPSNHLAWIAPLVAIAGVASYFAWFSMYPILRDFPWLNLGILGAAVALSIVALRRGSAGWGRVGSIAGLVVSVGSLALLSAYCFVLSYQFPDANRLSEGGTRIPAITLASWDGTSIDVAEAASDKLILVFYRGFW